MTPRTLFTVPATLLLAATLATPGPRASTTDQQVLDAVFRDLLSESAGDSPVSIRGRLPCKLMISPRSLNWPITLEDVLYRHEPEPWQALPAAAGPALRQAAEHLIARAEAGGISGIGSSDERVTVREPIQRRLTPGDFPLSRPIEAWPPGFSSDHTLALVRLYIPWSMHHAEGTYVLVKRDNQWVITVRQFLYYA